jgi:beta-glucosidase-like glycosyl hydrolase
MQPSSIMRLSRTTTARALAAAAAAASVAVAQPPGLTLANCTAGDAHQSWTYDATTGALSTAAQSPPLCATAAAWPPGNGDALTMAPCDGGDHQRFLYVPANSTWVLAAAPGYCVNVADYGVTPGSTVWLYECSAAACKGNCAWAASGTGGEWVNPISGLCLQDFPGPPLPFTCAPGSPAAGLPFCDPALPVGDRVADLLARLDLPSRIGQFSAPVQRFAFVPSLNVKHFVWDATCIHGIAATSFSDTLNVSVFPHALAQAASWDVGLAARVGAATATEARILTHVRYNASGGTSWEGTSCDGGPLANTQHDPRWGRVAETYGEDPVLAGGMGVAAMRALQNRSADGRWMAVSQATRHWLGYHAANDLPGGGNEYIDFHAFADQQAPVYRALQVDGSAEGLMCAMSAFAIGARADWGTPLAPLVPSCVHPYLWATLRDEWGWGGFVQSDCCDSLNQAVSAHHYFPDIATAVRSAIEAGLQASYGPDTNIDTAVAAMVANGTLDEGLLNARIARTLATRFALGEFDIGANPDYPAAYAAPGDPSVVDGPAHRALAREAAAAGLVLLHNDARLLPLTPATALPPGATLAVIGPLADCTSRGDADSPLACSYGHSYAGYSSAVSTPLSALREVGAAGGFRVTYAQGSNILTPLGPGSTGIDAAVAAAAGANVTVLVVGLTSLVERESFDRANLTLPSAQQALVDAVTAAAPPGRVVLVVIGAGGVDTSYAAAGAALVGAYPGEETGHGLTDVLTGAVNPSGRLPLTIYKQAYLDHVEPVAVFTMVCASGAGRTYRYLNETATGGAPGSLVHYWFGHGLSYSTFAYSGLSANLVAPLPPPGAPGDTPLVTVTVSVANSGTGAGAEVVQVYVTVPRGPAVANATRDAPVPTYSLAAFTKTAPLAPGAPPTQLTFSLPVRAFQTTTSSGTRVVTGGEYVVSVGGHMPGDTAGGASASNVLTASVTLPPPPPPS